jgi:hypothetical protein
MSYSAIGLGETKIRKYVKYQEEKEKREINKSLASFRGLFSLKPPAIQVSYLLCSKVFKYIWSS